MSGAVVEQRAQTWLVIQLAHSGHPWQDLSRREVPDDERAAREAGREMAGALDALNAQHGPISYRLIQRDRIEVTTEEVLDE